MVVQNFDSFYKALIEIVLPRILTSQHTGGYFEFNDVAEFADTIKKISGITVNFSSDRRLNHNFPPLERINLVAELVRGKVSAGATEAPGREGAHIAHLKARGEFLERVSAYYPLDTLTDNPEKDTETLSEFAQERLNAKKLFSFGYTKVPSTTIYYGLQQIINQSTDPKRQMTTNGCAGHFDKNQAILSALLELIQRDAFLVHWHNTISPKKIDVDAYIKNQSNTSRAHTGLTRVVSDLRRYNLEYHFLDVTSDIPVPAVCCAVITKSVSGTRISVGASAGFDPDAALLSSVTEATSVASSDFFRETITLPKDYKPYTDRRIGQLERRQVYTTDHMFEHIKFLVESKTRTSVTSWATLHNTVPKNTPIPHAKTAIRDTLAHLKSFFVERGKKNPAYEVRYFEVKNKLLQKFDYHVVRVLCDALYPLYLREDFADPQHPRIKEFAQNMGYEKIAKENIWPHPFP